MSKVIEDALAHFRAKLNRHLKIVNDCYAEIARLESLQREGNPTTLAVDTPLAVEDEGDSIPYGLSFRETKF